MRNKSQSIRKSLIIIALLSILSFTFYYRPSFAEKGASPDDIIQTYIQSMKTQDYEKLSSVFVDSDGYDPDVSSTYAYRDNWNNPNKEVVPGERNLNKLLDKQYKFILTCFGDDAWNNVSYSIEAVPSQDKYEKYVMRDSGAEITKDQYEKANKDFWSKYAAKKGLGAESFFEPKNDGQINLLTEKSKGILEPAVVELVDRYSQYIVYFRFKENTVSTSGEYDFYFHVYNKNGSWMITSPLKWHTPAIAEEQRGD